MRRDLNNPDGRFATCTGSSTRRPRARLEGSLSPWALTASLSPDPPRYLRDEDEATWKAREKAEADAKAKEEGKGEW